MEQFQEAGRRVSRTIRLIAPRGRCAHGRVILRTPTLRARRGCAGRLPVSSDRRVALASLPLQPAKRGRGSAGAKPRNRCRNPALRGARIRDRTHRRGRRRDAARPARAVRDPGAAESGGNLARPGVAGMVPRAPAAGASRGDPSDLAARTVLGVRRCGRSTRTFLVIFSRASSEPGLPMGFGPARVRPFAIKCAALPRSPCLGGAGSRRT
jgi:hypothetical protein